MRIRPKRRWTSLATLVTLASFAGCHSPYVRTSIVNHTGGTIRLIEVDYPNASFGTQQIEENQTFNYRFKVQDSGPVKITYTGEDGNSRTSSGPNLNEGEQGALTITLGVNGNVTWTPNLSPAK